LGLARGHLCAEWASRRTGQIAISPERQEIGIRLLIAISEASAHRTSGADVALHGEPERWLSRDRAYSAKDSSVGNKREAVS
jgi:hypothetical protein